MITVYGRCDRCHASMRLHDCAIAVLDRERFELCDRCMAELFRWMQGVVE